MPEALHRRSVLTIPLLYCVLVQSQEMSFSGIEDDATIDPPSLAKDRARQLPVPTCPPPGCPVVDATIRPSLQKWRPRMGEKWIDEPLQVTHARTHTHTHTHTAAAGKELRVKSVLGNRQSVLNFTQLNCRHEGKVRCRHEGAHSPHRYPRQHQQRQ